VCRKLRPSRSRGTRLHCGPEIVPRRPTPAGSRKSQHERPPRPGGTSSGSVDELRSLSTALRGVEGKAQIGQQRGTGDSSVRAL